MIFLTNLILENYSFFKICCGPWGLSKNNVVSLIVPSKGLWNKAWFIRILSKEQTATVYSVQWNYNSLYGKTLFFYFEYPICSLRTAAVDSCQSLESLFKTPKKEFVISYLYIKFSNFHLEYPIFLCTSLLLMQRSSLRLSSYIFVGNKISTPSTNLSSYLKKPLQKNK